MNWTVAFLVERNDDCFSFAAKMVVLNVLAALTV